MSEFMDFITLPLGLPINPLLEFVVMAIIGEVVYRIAYSAAGDLGGTSSERSVLHWLIRIPLYFMVWAFVCGCILAYHYIAENPWVLIVLGGVVIAIVTIIIVVKVRKRKDKNGKSNEGQRN